MDVLLRVALRISKPEQTFAVGFPFSSLGLDTGLHGEIVSFRGFLFWNGSDLLWLERGAAITVL